VEHLAGGPVLELVADLAENVEPVLVVALVLLPWSRSASRS
jgi:hypothetical protein